MISGNKVLHCLVQLSKLGNRRVRGDSYCEAMCVAPLEATTPYVASACLFEKQSTCTIDCLIAYGDIFLNNRNLENVSREE